jgi:fumarylacetoacetate (FAA) hydrolase
VLRQGSSSVLLGPCDDIVVASEKIGVDFAAQLAAITGDVPLGAKPEQALEGVRLLMLANDITLRQLADAERERGTPPCLSQPATAFSPVAITPDELVGAWQGGRVHLSLQCTLNGKRVGLVETGPEMQFHFGQLIAHLCKTRPVPTGSVIGSGCVSNADAKLGYACLADKRALETLEHGEPKTAYLQFGDTLRIEMKGLDGQSLFGPIEQSLVAAQDERHRIAPGAAQDAAVTLETAVDRFLPRATRHEFDVSGPRPPSPRG